MPSIIQALLLAAVTLSGAQTKAAEKPDFDKISRQITDFRTKALGTTAGGKTAVREEVWEATANFAKSLLVQIDPKSIPSEDAGKWAQLFTLAHLSQEAERLQMEAIGYHNVELMFAEGDLIHNLIADGKDDQAMYLVKHAPDYDASMLGMVGQSFTSACHEAKYDQTKPEYVAKGLKALMAKVDFEANPNRKTPSMADYVYVDLDMKLLEMRYALHPSPTILADMQALKKRFASSKSVNAYGQSPAFRVDEFAQKVVSIGKPAPEVTFEKSIGDFHGLASLKGKVVVLDFMAHWCGPCKAALPAIKKMQDLDGAKGLQVVSVTSFYGYYGSQQGVKPGEEFAKMHDFVKQYEMGWPVIFDTKQVTQAKYHVSAIPQMVVIDRKGMIRKVEVGYTKESGAEVSALVEKLLAES